MNWAIRRRELKQVVEEETRKTRKKKRDGRGTKRGAIIYNERGPILVKGSN